MNKYVEEYIQADLEGKLEILSGIYQTATAEEKKTIVNEIVRLQGTTNKKLY